MVEAAKGEISSSADELNWPETDAEGDVEDATVRRCKLGDLKRKDGKLGADIIMLGTWDDHIDQWSSYCITFKISTAMISRMQSDHESTTSMISLILSTRLHENDFHLLSALSPFSSLGWSAASGEPSLLKSIKLSVAGLLDAVIGIAEVLEDDEVIAAADVDEPLETSASSFTLYFLEAPGRSFSILPLMDLFVADSRRVKNDAPIPPPPPRTAEPAPTESTGASTWGSNSRKLDDVGWDLGVSVWLEMFVKVAASSRWLDVAVFFDNTTSFALLSLLFSGEDLEKFLRRVLLKI